MTDEEILEEQNAYYMAGYPSRRSENKMDKEELEKEAKEWSFRKKYTYGYSYTFEQVLDAYIDGVRSREKQLAVAREIIENLLPFERVIDPYALTSDIEENKRRFHEPFRKAEQFLEEIKEK